MTSSPSVPPFAASLAEFAAITVHGLRTPLTALSGEVELALRRERTPAYYQEALARVAERVAELLDMTADLAFIGSQERTADGAAESVTSLGAAFEALSTRFARRPGARVTIEPLAGEHWVEGDGPLVAGALAILIELAVRRRHDGAGIRLRAANPADSLAGASWVELILEATPGGLWPVGDAGCGMAPATQIALAVAAAAMERCGASAAPVTLPAGGGFCVRLHRVARPGEAER